MELSLSDPTYVPSGKSWPLQFINDDRDVPFLRLSALITLTVVPTGVGLFFDFRWWLAGVHVALTLWFLGPFILMLHNTSHRKFFKTRFARLNHFIPWVLGPFFGETPDTYFAHHVGMHHPENNLADDLSTTLPYRRDSIWGFARYFTTFFFTVAVALPIYFVRKRRHALAVKSVLGEVLFLIGAGALCFVEWRAVAVVFFFPYLLTRFLMMCGNWGQHAFVDRDAPENCYRNSITCINSGYNRRCFNDGYHIGHHVKATRHWTEMPEDFSKNLETYRKEKAIVFEKIDFFIVWIFLMLGRYDWLAKHYVTLETEKPSQEEIIALLKSRVQWHT